MVARYVNYLKGKVLSNGFNHHSFPLRQANHRFLLDVEFCILSVVWQDDDTMGTTDQQHDDADDCSGGEVGRDTGRGAACPCRARNRWSPWQHQSAPRQVWLQIHRLNTLQVSVSAVSPVHDHEHQRNWTELPERNVTFLFTYKGQRSGERRSVWGHLDLRRLLRQVRRAPILVSCEIRIMNELYL